MMDIAFQIPLRVGPVQGLSWAVIYWGLCCLLGIAFKTANILAAVRQMRKVEPHHDEAGLWITALFTLLGQVTMGFVLLVCVGLAALAALTSPSHAPIRRNTVLLVYCFDLLVTAIVAHAVLLWLGQRLALNRIWQARDREGVEG